MTQQTPHAIDDIVRGRVGWVRDGRIGLRIDGSDYELHLVLAGDPHALPP